jgi:DNA-binding response OmpR family regulator
VTTVLVVEDNADLRAFIRETLEPTYRVREASDGEQGLRRASDMLPDLVLSDATMPRMDGFALAAALRSRPETASIPVVLLTARARASDRLAGLEAGADAYLTKPFDAEALRLQVRNLIARQQRLRESLPPPPRDTAPEPPRSAFETSVRDAIENRLTDPDFNVSALAETLAMGRKALHRRLKDDLGETPGTYLRTYRLERAAELLRARQGNVTEVAYAVGFNSQSHFSRCFRDHFGTPPSAFAQDDTAG